MQIRNLFAGNGNRRKTDAQWTKLQQQLSTTQRDLAAANEQIATLTEQRDQARRNDIRHHNLWQSADREVRRLGFLLGADAQLPATQVPAPVDNGSRDTPQANADTQPVNVRDLRAAMGENDTITLPAVSPITPVAELDDTQMLVTWGRARDTEAAVVEAALNSPAPSAEYAATAVPPGLPDLAQGKVAAALATTTAD